MKMEARVLPLLLPLLLLAGGAESHFAASWRRIIPSRIANAFRSILGPAAAESKYVDASLKF